MERTHSIMRIATTASPVSGDAVRQQMHRLNIRAKYLQAIHTIHVFWRQYSNHRDPKEKVKDDRSDSDEEPAPHRQPTKALVGPSHRLSVRSQARVLLDTLEEHEQGRRRGGNGSRPRRDAQEEIAMMDDDAGNRRRNGPLRAPMPRD